MKLPIKFNNHNLRLVFERRRRTIGQPVNGKTLNGIWSEHAGGDTRADTIGSLYTLDGSIGEPAAEVTSSAGTYSAKGGFLSSLTLAPTAASVSISGRITTLDGSGLIGARVRTFQLPSKFI